MLIDCSGDAEACHLAGCSTSFGRQLDGRAQPYTSVKIFAAGNKVSWRNFDSGCTNQTDGDELSQALLFSHAQHLEDYYTDDNRLLQLAPHLGIREGRLIEGEETITIEDFFADRISGKPVFYAYADIDKHGRDNAFESRHLKDWFVASNLGAVNVTVPIPMGALIPRGYDGLLAAGRCLAVDHDLSTCVRMNRDMQKSGEAAATAAWLAITKEVPVKDVPYEELIALLTETGCYNPDNNKGYQFAYPSGNKPVQPIEWLTDPEQIRMGLSTLQPGVAIWSCRRLGSTIVDSLREWVLTEEETLRKHSAFALAVLDDEACLPVLREMVKERDSVVLQDVRKNNQMRGHVAIYLLGRINDVHSVKELAAIVTIPEEYDRPLYRLGEGTDGKAKKYNDVYFQFFSHTVMALIQIGEHHPAQREAIGEALIQAVKNGAYLPRITHMPYGTYEHSIAANIQSVAHDALERWGQGDKEY
ncbi:FAD-dependent oxidoreductase [Paenibacillus sp. CC-CFT747]|nr:FAD-dependent oxidoreductase [Paenibacillus sp. CC-CFT747]